MFGEGAVLTKVVMGGISEEVIFDLRLGRKTSVI